MQYDQCIALQEYIIKYNFEIEITIKEDRYSSTTKAYYIYI